MPVDPTALLLSLAGSPPALFAALFLLTFILEDVATVAAGLLAGRGLIDPGVALAGLALGTAAGDLALHGLGRWAAATRPGRRLAARADVARATGWLARRGLWLVAGARFVPGLRLPVFAASGFARLPLAGVAAVVAGCTLVWTPALFFLGGLPGGAGLAAAALLFTGGALAARWLNRAPAKEVAGAMA